MSEIVVPAAYLIGFAFTAGWATQHTDFDTAILVGALWPVFWIARLVRFFG